MNSKNEPGETPLHYAAASFSHSSYEVAELLIESGSDINLSSNTGDTALHIAARLNHKNVAIVLISNGANILIKNCNNETALEK